MISMLISMVHLEERAATGGNFLNHCRTRWHTHQNAFMMKTLYSTDSAAQVQHDFQTFKCMQSTRISVINRMIRKFKNTGSMTDNKKAIVSRKGKAISVNNITCINETVIQSPCKSAKHLSK
jgi:hypothetical protein